MKNFLYKIFYEEPNQKILDFVKKNYLINLQEQLYWYIIFNLEESFPNMNILPDWNNTIILIQEHNNTKYKIEFLELNSIRIISNNKEIVFKNISDIFNK